MPTNDFLPFAGSGGANSITQAAYVALTTLRANGFLSGTAESNQLNKVWRQSSIMSAVLAQFIADISAQNTVDDGTTITILANLKTSMDTLIGNAIITPTNDPTYVNNTSKAASTSWIRSAMATLAITAGFSASFTNNGYFKLPSWFGSWCLSWATFITPTAATPLTVTMPYTYTISMDAVWVSAGGINQYANGGSISLSTCSVTTNQNGGGGTVFAIGR